MTILTPAPHQPDSSGRPDPRAVEPGRNGFARLLHAEWTKFRTVRGWVIGMLAAAVVFVLVGLM
nr:hypothetical protein [Micromonospora sp. DSM 115978]